MAVFKVIDKKYESVEDTRKLIQYIIGKAEYWNCSTVLFRGNSRELLNQITYIRRCFGKMDGNMMGHMVLSLDSQKYEKEVGRREMICLGNHFCNLFMDHQSIYAIHEDTKHLHLHFIFNTVSYKDGKRYHCSPQEFKAFKRRLANILATEKIALAGETCFDERGKLQYESLGPALLYMNKLAML